MRFSPSKRTEAGRNNRLHLLVGNGSSGIGILPMSGGPAQTHGQDGRATADIRTLPTFARGGFTLAEVLAALLLMAIVIPVALEGMSVISRAAVLGQRKVAAMRVAEGVLNEQLLLLSQGEVVENSASGVVTDGGTDFPWTLQSEAWAQDAMTQLTVRVTFTVRGAQYEMKASTLFDPTADTPGTPGKAPVAAGAP